MSSSSLKPASIIFAARIQRLPGLSHLSVGQQDWLVIITGGHPATGGHPNQQHLEL
ncbi:hypothetical protein RchiOBHm_Chr1g0348641 [Rosa chinensis]|uniref:Uncharacterized protein n=1 Tax=Rosa chinensis TaxID=74649 RepID=A0A2P6SFJ4_ROSCH|nr:hypothetical protein RchiOBHm_Chr1g0348641 [Rosa chinensis]